MKKAVLVFAAILLMLAPAGLRGQFTYTTNSDGTLTITGATNAITNLIIPASINGLTVSTIGSNAFSGGFHVTNVSLPDTITTIESYAFFECPLVTNITIPASVTSIGDNAFAIWENLTSITIPDSVTNLGAMAFSGSFAMTNAVVGTGVSVLDYTFEDCTALANVTIPTNITFLEGTFAACTFTNFTIPPSVTNISDAFEQCTNLTRMTVPGTVTELGDYTFYGCTSLTNIVLSDGVADIGPYDFESCGITRITIPASVTNIAGCTSYYDDVEGAPFEGCASLTNVTILGSPTIGVYAFYNQSLQSANIAGGVIGDRAFQDCESLTTVTLGSNVTVLGDVAFFGDPISNIYIPSSVTYIGDNTFGGCEQLTNVVVAAGTMEIQDFAFDQSFHLTTALFLGNAPTVIQGGDQPPFGDCPVTVYYLPGTTGWSNTFGQTIYFNDGAPTALWNPIIQTGGGNIRISNGQFGFTVTNGSTANLPVSILACTNLANPVWTPITNITLTNTFYFTDTQWSNYPTRFYGLGFP